MADSKTRLGVADAGYSGPRGESITFTLPLPYCTDCANRHAKGEKIRLAAAIITALVGALVGGILKGAGAAGGGALLGFVVAYFIVHAVYESLFEPVKMDPKSRPRFKNKEYQALFDRANPA